MKIQKTKIMNFNFFSNVLNIKNMKKTDKTVTELNLDININLTLSKVIEEGKVLTPLYGPG